MSNSVQMNLARSILAYEASLNAAKQADLPVEIIQGNGVNTLQESDED